MVSAFKRKCGSCSKMLIWDFWFWYAKRCSRHCQVWSIQVINSLLENRNTSSNDSICGRNHIFSCPKQINRWIDDALTSCNWWGHMMESTCWGRKGIGGQGEVGLVKTYCYAKWETQYRIIGWCYNQMSCSKDWLVEDRGVLCDG